jgi:hypothetical protein
MSTGSRTTLEQAFARHIAEIMEGEFDVDKLHGALIYGAGLVPVVSDDDDDTVENYLLVWPANAEAPYPRVFAVSCLYRLKSEFDDASLKVGDFTPDGRISIWQFNDSLCMMVESLPADQRFTPNTRRAYTLWIHNELGASFTDGYVAAIHGE